MTTPPEKPRPSSQATQRPTPDTSPIHAPGPPTTTTRTDSGPPIFVTATLAGYCGFACSRCETTCAFVQPASANVAAWDGATSSVTCRQRGPRRALTVLKMPSTSEPRGTICAYEFGNETVTQLSDCPKPY